jgi:hypothetical protein
VTLRTPQDPDLLPGARAGKATPRYVHPHRLVLAVAASVLLHRKRNLGADAARLVRNIAPPPSVENAHLIPNQAPFLLVANHYSRRGYQVWWGAALLTSVIEESQSEPAEIIWLMTNRWTYSDWLRSHLITPLTHMLLTRLARTYGLISMPPMPPQPQYVEEGAQGVRRVLTQLRRRAPEGPPILCLAPEGRDSPDGSLIEPPPGTGRFLMHIHKQGLPVVPAGVAEINGLLTARFGPPFALQSHPEQTKGEQDRQASAQVMTSIGLQLPEALWGAFRLPILQAKREHSEDSASG